MSSAVARLRFEDSSTDPPTKATFILYPNKTLKFGRDEKTNDHAFSDANVSRNHLEFYSIVFDDGAEPMVYVRDRQSNNGTFVNDVLIGRSDRISPARLLQHDDYVTARPNWRFRVELLAMDRVELTDIQKMETNLFANEYAISNMILGTGATTKVRLAHEMKTGAQLACKIYDLQCLSPSQSRKILRSLSMLSQTEHPNVTSCKRAYKSPHTLYVFEELASGGDLFSLTMRSKEFKELEVQWIIFQILQGLAYLHKKGIAHRDIKPENILCMICPKPAHRVALTDFGHAGSMKKGRRDSFCGTDGYQAPEILRPDGTHNVAVDMWSLGILVVQLLAGNTQLQSLQELGDVLPENPWMESVDLETIFKELCSARTDPIHKSAEDFIRCCLKTNSRERMTAVDALKHAWIDQASDSYPQLRSGEQQTVESQDQGKGYRDLIHDLIDVKKFKNKRRPRQRTFGNRDAAPAEKSPYFVKPQSPKKAHSRKKATSPKEAPNPKEADSPKLVKQKKPAKISDEVSLATAEGESLRRIRDGMSTSQRIKQFGSHGKLGDMSLGGHAVGLDRRLSPKKPPGEREREKKKLLEELRDRGVNFVPRNSTWPLRQTGEAEGATKRRRSDDATENNSAKRKRVVLDPDTGRPINFDDPWSP